MTVWLFFAMPPSFCNRIWRRMLEHTRCLYANLRSFSRSRPTFWQSRTGWRDRRTFHICPRWARNLLSPYVFTGSPGREKLVTRRHSYNLYLACVTARGTPIHHNKSMPNSLHTDMHTCDNWRPSLTAESTIRSINPLKELRVTGTCDLPEHSIHK